MGGYGSGRRVGNIKKTTACYYQLDVRRWQRDGLLAGGQFFAWQWTQDDEVVSSINVKSEPSRVILSYGHRESDEEAWHSEQYPVWLDWTPCNYGGARAWFLCPARGCGRRVAILYLGTLFACRHCYQLVYNSQRAQAWERALSKAQAIRVRLGGTANMYAPFPWKPRGMHWRTYHRLRFQAAEADTLSYPPGYSGWLSGG
jgi:hypothetical protein